MTKCRIPKYCKRYRIDVLIYDVESKNILPRSARQKKLSVYIHKNHYCGVWMKIRKDAILNGEEIKRTFKSVKIKINDSNLNQRVRYQFPKHETKDQVENVFAFALETYKDQEFAEAYEAGLHDVNHLRDHWDRDLTPDELVTEKHNVIVFDGCKENPVMNLFQFFSKNYVGDERTYFDKDGDEIVSS